MSLQKKEPERTCIVCKAHLPKENFIRVVKTKNEDFFVDVVGKMQGRGIYICKSAACVQKAKKTRAISRVFRIPTPNSLYEELEKVLDNDQT